MNENICQFMTRILARQAQRSRLCLVDILTSEILELKLGDWKNGRCGIIYRDPRLFTTRLLYTS